MKHETIKNTYEILADTIELIQTEPEIITAPFVTASVYELEKATYYGLTDRERELYADDLNNTLNEVIKACDEKNPRKASELLDDYYNGLINIELNEPAENYYSDYTC